MNSLKEILSQENPDILAMLKSGETEILKNAYEPFTNPKFRTGQTGTSRRDINVWRKEELLPYTNEESKWNQFSLTECVWLRFVAMLKKFGVDKENIRQIKNVMFSTEPALIRDAFQNMRNMPNLPKEIDGFLLEILKNFDKFSEEEIQSSLNEINFSFFGLVVMLCCKLHLNYAIIINEEGDYTFLNIGKPLKEKQLIEIGEPMRLLINRSFLLINMYQLCKDFFENETVLIDSSYYFGLMNEFEKRVLTEIRTGKYKMVTVKVDDGAITHIKLTKKEDENEEMIRKLSRFFKTNDFKDVELTTRDGVIIKYSETDIVKMNTK
jgi:hypothetical protein